MGALILLQQGTARSHLPNAPTHPIVNEVGATRLSRYTASPHLDPRDRSHARSHCRPQAGPYG